MEADSISCGGRKEILMKTLLLACCLVLFTMFSVQGINADIAKPKPSEKSAKVVLHTSLEIVPDAKAYDAKLQISQSDFNNLHAGLAGDFGSGPIARGISHVFRRRSVSRESHDSSIAL